MISTMQWPSELTILLVSGVSETEPQTGSCQFEEKQHNLDTFSPEDIINENTNIKCKATQIGTEKL